MLECAGLRKFIVGARKGNIKVVAAIAVVLSSSSAQSGGRGGGGEGKLNDP